MYTTECVLICLIKTQNDSHIKKDSLSKHMKKSKQKKTKQHLKLEIPKFNSYKIVYLTV